MFTFHQERTTSFLCLCGFVVTFESEDWTQRRENEKRQSRWGWARIVPVRTKSGGRERSTLAPLGALRARTPESTWARRAVDEGVRSCPKPDAGKPTCTVP